MAQLQHAIAATPGSHADGDADATSPDTVSATCTAWLLLLQSLFATAHALCDATHDNQAADNEFELPSRAGTSQLVSASG